MESTHPVCGSVEVDWFAKAWVNMGMTLTGEETLGMCSDFVAHIPLERVIRPKTNLPILCFEELCVGMCNLTYLHLTEVNLSEDFADPGIRDSHTSKDLLPGLDHLKITAPTLGRSYWSPLTEFLTRRAAVANRLSSLVFTICPRMCPEDIESIKQAVDVFLRRGMGMNQSIRSLLM